VIFLKIGPNGAFWLQMMIYDAKFCFANHKQDTLCTAGAFLE